MRLTTLVGESRALGAKLDEVEIVEKFFSSVTDKFTYIIGTLEQIIDIEDMTITEAIGRLRTWEENARGCRKGNGGGEDQLLYMRADWETPSSKGRRDDGKREIKANLAKQEDDDQGLLMAEVCDTIKTVVEKPTREVLLQEEKMVPKLSRTQDIEGPTTEMEHKLDVQALRTDHDREFTSNEVNNYCKKIGTERLLTVPYTPQQNRVVERRNRTVV